MEHGKLQKNAENKIESNDGSQLGSETTVGCFVAHETVGHAGVLLDSMVRRRFADTISIN